MRKIGLLWQLAVLTGLLGMSSCKTQLLPKVSEKTMYPIDQSISADTAIVSYYLPFKAQLESEMNRVIGFSDVHLNKNREAQSLVGNFFADALLAEGKKIDSDVVASFSTKGGIRAELKAGNITIGNVFEIMPFENALTVVELSSTDMRNLGKFVAKTGGQPVAGLQISIKGDQLQELLVDGKPLDPTKTYKLVTYDYLANGGDYVDFLQNPIQRVDHKQRVREALIAYITALTNKGKHIQAQIDGRVRKIN